jgi:ADP-ribose pyrophosphatase YjhB (NUDIX family)
MDNVEFITTEDFFDEIEKQTELPGVSALIMDEKGRILMFLHKRLGKWTIPVGKPELGEDPLVAVQREVNEETNLTVLGATFVGCRQFQSQYNADSSLNTFWNSQLYVIDYNGKAENMEPSKHLEMRFMTLEEIYALADTQISHATKLMLHYLEYLELQYSGKTSS